MTLLQELPRDKKEQIAEVYCEKARRHLIDFCYLTNPSYLYAKHLELAIQKLEAVERGELKKLMIFMPPRHGKSELVSIRFPAWAIGKNPNRRIIHSSYASNLSCHFSRQVRNLVEEKKYRMVFGLNTADDSRAVDNWNIQGAKGGMLASGVGGAITGYGADIFIIDDPVKNQEEAESEVYRDKIWEWYRSVARTRLEPNASIILLMTRWHQQDLAGKILEEETDWEVINLPALAETEDVLGRQIDEALWQERYPKDQLIKIRSDVGTRVWNSLFQGHPVNPEGAIIKRDWVRWYEVLPPATNRFGGSDTATSKRDVADNMALVDVCKDSEGFLYCDDVFCEKVSVTTFANTISNRQRITPYVRIKIESNNAGEAIKQRIDEVGRLDGTIPPVFTEATDTDKVVRVIEFQHLIENGTLKFKKGNRKVAQLVDHLCNFDGKGADIDDDIDALGFAIKASQGSGVKIWSL